MSGKGVETESISLDTIDITILVYLASNGHNFFVAVTAKEIAERQEIAMSSNAIVKRLASLRRNGLIEIGIKTNRMNGYYITDQGKNLLEEMERSSSAK